MGDLDLVKTLKSGYPEYDRVKLSIIKDPELHNELLQMEKKLMFKTYKFGVLYCKDGQTDEVDMFQNGFILLLYLSYESGTQSILSG